MEKIDEGKLRKEFDEMFINYLNELPDGVSDSVKKVTVGLAQLFLYKIDNIEDRTKLYEIIESGMNTLQKFFNDIKTICEKEDNNE